MYGAEPKKMTSSRVTREVLPRLRQDHKQPIKWFRGCIHEVMITMRRKLKLRAKPEERPHMYLHTMRDTPSIDETTDLYLGWLRVMGLGFQGKGVVWEVFATEHYNILVLYGDRETLVFYGDYHNINWKLSAFFKRESDSIAKTQADYKAWLLENGYDD